MVQVCARLMDAVDPTLVDSAAGAVSSVEGVRGVRDLRVRWIGHTLRAATFHVSPLGARPRND